MKAMLTSFGVEHSIGATADQESTFHRMPPVSFRAVNQAFMPDYELLLLCDRVVMDEVSFDRLMHGSVAAYRDVANTYKALYDEGRIELVDFSTILRPHANLLRQMVEQDLKLLDQWIEPLRESLRLWQRFMTMSRNILVEEREESADGLSRDTFNAHAHQRVLATSFRNALTHNPLLQQAAQSLHHDRRVVAMTSMLVDEALRSSRKRRRAEHRAALRDALRGYLVYVDANLILCHQLQLGFHDWVDFTPFYSAKFRAVGQEIDRINAAQTQLEKLFTVPFPEFAIRNTQELMKALNDRRVEDLRHLVDEAVEGRAQFDNDFAKAVLREVFRNAGRAKRLRNIVGYITLPIDLIPVIGPVAQKAVEEAVGLAIDNKSQRQHRWFYMLSDIAESRESAV